MSDRYHLPHMGNTAPMMPLVMTVNHLAHFRLGVATKNKNNRIRNNRYN
ncbi:hypothetical protein ABMA09_24905 [Erwinia rhapontici]